MFHLYSAVQKIIDKTLKGGKIMSFVTELNKKCQEYTNMIINGTKIFVPYKNGRKNLPTDIRNALINSGKTGAELQQ